MNAASQGTFVYLRHDIGGLVCSHARKLCIGPAMRRAEQRKDRSALHSPEGVQWPRLPSEDVRHIRDETGLRMLCVNLIKDNTGRKSWSVQEDWTHFSLQDSSNSATGNGRGPMIQQRRDASIGRTFASTRKMLCHAYTCHMTSLSSADRHLSCAGDRAFRSLSDKVV